MNIRKLNLKQSGSTMNELIYFVALAEKWELDKVKYFVFAGKSFIREDCVFK